MVIRVLKKYKEAPVQVKASLWFLICAFSQKAVSALTTPVFTRLMSTAEYGQFSVFSSWMSICNCLVTLNLYGGFYTQGLVKYDSNRKQFTSSLHGLTALLVLVWLTIYGIFHHIVNSFLSLTTTQVLFMFVLMWTTACFSFWSVEQRVDYKYKKLVLLTLLTSFLTPILGVILVIISRDKVTVRILSMVLVAIALYPILAFKQIKDGKVLFSKTYWKYALSFSIPLVPHYLSQMILNSSDRIMISKMVNDSAAGIYSLAYSIAQIMMLFNTALLQTIEPWVFKKIKSSECEKIHTVAYPAFIGIGVVNLILIVLAPEIITIFAPATYYDAIWVIPPITMGVYFQFTYSFFALFEFYYEKPNYITISTLTGAILNIALNYIFIKIFGYYAAGYTTLACYVVYAVMHYLFMMKICRTKMKDVKIYDLKILLLISLTFVCLGFAFMATYSYPYVRYAVLAGIIIIIALKWRTLKGILKRLISMKRGQE